MDQPIKKLRPQRLSCSAIPEEYAEGHTHDDEDGSRALSWHHPERPLTTYEVLPFSGGFNGSRRESFRSISHDSVVVRPSSKLMTDEGLQDWVLAALKNSRNALTNPILQSGCK